MGNRAILLYAILVLPAMSAGCKHAPAPPSHDRDLSDDDSVVLLPVAPPWSNPALKDGTADWPAFNASEDEPKPDDSSRKQEELISEIRELIDEYNGLVDDGVLDDLVEFFAEEQQDAVRPYIEAGLSLSKKMGALRDALEEKAPNSTDGISVTFRDLASKSIEKLSVDAITYVSPTELTGRLPLLGAQAECRFLLKEEMWFIELFPLPDFAGVKPIVDQVLAAFDTWRNKLESGDGSVESVLTEIEQRAESLAGLLPNDEKADEPGSDDE